MSTPTYIDWDSTPISTVAGDDILWSTQVRDGAGDVEDITGWTFSFYAIEQEDETNTITITNSGFTITDAGEGQVRWAIASATTQTQGGKIFRAELWRTNAGSAKRLCAGTWSVGASIRY
jgi:hypothetical protein